jgi:hypothetical protein
LPTLAVKNELVKLGTGVFDSLTKKKDDDYLATQQRMLTAYGLLCFTAFFEALDKQLSKELRKKIGLLGREKIVLAEGACEKDACTSKETDDRTRAAEASNPLTALAISFPHPTESLAQQAEGHTQLWTRLSVGFKDFIKKLAFWDETKENEQAKILSAIDEIPKVAHEYFEAQYFELARRYEDFAVWGNLQERKKTKELIETLSKYVQQHAELSRSGKASIDIGFSKLHAAVLSIPETLKISQAAEIVHSLTLHYDARVNEPIIEEKEEPHDDKPRLVFPKISDAFIPQSFRVLRQIGQARPLEDEATWKDLPRGEDLGAFLLSYLSSPYSTETPLVILGHPGSGKSLLTTVLSAQLMSNHYTAIRVPLREVDAEVGIIGQIQERIRWITKTSEDSWAKLSGAFKNNPPLVILDGYDELLQASGKVFSNYLQEAQNFQKGEAEQRRPVRVIVTSRITLIDKAAIPRGTTILRLLEFDKRQRDRWISIWNKTNADYFKQAEVKEFELPKEEDAGSEKILSLAEQPLLLLMLALYDSQKNELRGSKALDRTLLYDSLLRRFVDRELSKDKKGFLNLSTADQKKELDREMQRLGVTALGMYNRRKLHILSSELNEDLKFFSLERPITAASGRPLSQAELLLGSFFFVHRSRAQHTAGAPQYHEETLAFEFLHNTFGEFLTADFVLRQALAEVEQLKAINESDVLRASLGQRLNAADAFSSKWFASLVFTPLFTRPVVLEMMREWVAQALKRKKLSRQEFISHLDTIILNQIERLLTNREMPSIIRKEPVQEGYRAPFVYHPLVGHIAIYSINLILLRAIVGSEPFVFNENQIRTQEDGARPWDRLTHIWRSWFSLDNLNGVTAVMRAERKGTSIEIRPKDRFQVAESQSRLDICLNVALSLGDNIASGLTGLLLFEPGEQNPLELEDIASRLGAEKIDFEFQIKMKSLFRSQYRFENRGGEEFSLAVRQALEMAFDRRKYEELEQIALTIRRSVRRLRWRDALAVFLNAVSPGLACEVTFRNPRAGLILYEVGKEIGEDRWLDGFRRRLARYLPDFLLDFIGRDPEAALTWLQLGRELGAGRVWERLRPEHLERIFHPRHLLDLSERNPRTALTWLQLGLELGAGRLWERDAPELLERIFDPRYLLELSKRSPEIALTWVQLARELGAGRAWERDALELLERVFDPRYLLELSERNPRTALTWLQLARELGAGRVWERCTPEHLERIFDPRHLLELSERSPEIALTWLQLARELGAGRVWERYTRAHLDRIFNPRYLLELSERSPETALTWLQLACELGAGGAWEVPWEEFGKRIYNLDVLTRLLRQKPSAFGAALRIARTLNAPRALEAAVRCLMQFLECPGGEGLLLETLPLSTLKDIQWLAKNEDNLKLSSVVRLLDDEANRS